MSPTFLDRADLEAQQLERLRDLLGRLVPDNPFWTPRLRAAGLDQGVESLEHFRDALPLLTKQELSEDQGQSPPYGTNFTYPIERYTRLHQTSSTTGEPLRCLDTNEDWAVMRACWHQVWEAAELTAADRFFCAFSFGPFIGFWLGWEAAQQIGALCIPGGGMDSRQRLQAMRASAVTVLGCTPTYALRLGEVARDEGVEIPTLRAIVVGGEPGASVPAVRATIEALWPGATLFDHHGMTEIGAVTYQTAHEPCVLHVLETDFLAEVLDTQSGAPLEAGAERLGELVLTNLTCPGRPLLRYRTRDLVRHGGYGAAPRPYLRLAGGISARADQMVVVRGVNVYPSAVDEVVRAVGGVAEYRVEVDRTGPMAELQLTIEPAPGADAADLCRRLERAFRDGWSLRVPVKAVGRDALPRFELKAKRWVEI